MFLPKYEKKLFLFKGLKKIQRAKLIMKITYPAENDGVVLLMPDRKDSQLSKFKFITTTKKITTGFLYKF